MPLLYQLVYFVSSFLMVALGAMIFFRRPQDRMVQAFMLLVMSIAGWIITLYFFYSFTDPAIVIVIGRLNFVFAEATAFFIFLFSYYFPQKSRRINPRILWTLFAGFLVFGLVTLLTDLVDENEIIVGVSRETSFGMLYPLFILEFIGFFSAGVVMLARKCRQSSGFIRRQLLVFASGVFIAFSFGIVTNIIVPYVMGWYELQHLGPLSALLFAAVTSYVVAKKELLNIEVIAAEFFVGVILLLFVINIATATSLPTLVTGVLSLFMVSGLGALLIKGIRNEEKQHRELELLTSQLTEANVRLGTLDEAKSEFISIASHQLRTPASVLKGYLAMMIDGDFGEAPATFKDKLQLMYSMNERLIHLINNILNMSRIEKNSLEFTCSYIDVVSAIDEVVVELTAKAKEKKLELRFDRSAAGLAKAYVDGEKLHEIVANLVENAIKYTVKGIVHVTVEIRRGLEGDEVVLKVTDSGIGMGEDDTKRLFEKFFRAKSAFGIPREVGTGLGLYICAKFLDNMGGRIWIEKTAPGKGTTFAVALPTKPRQRCANPE